MCYALSIQILSYSGLLTYITNTIAFYNNIFKNIRGYLNRHSFVLIKIKEKLWKSKKKR